MSRLPPLSGGDVELSELPVADLSMPVEIPFAMPVASAFNGGAAARTIPTITTTTTTTTASSAFGNGAIMSFDAFPDVPPPPLPALPVTPTTTTTPTLADRPASKQLFQVPEIPMRPGFQPGAKAKTDDDFGVKGEARRMHSMDLPRAPVPDFAAEKNSRFAARSVDYDVSNKMNKGAMIPLPKARPSGASNQSQISKVISLVKHETVPQHPAVAEFVALRHRASVEKERRSIQIDKKPDVAIGGAGVASAAPAAAAPKGEAKIDVEASKLLDQTQHQISLADFEVKFKTSATRGLTQKEAEERLLRDGPNSLTPPPRKSWLLRLIAHFIGGFQVLMVVGAILCFIVYGALDPSDHQTFWLGIVLLIVVFVTGLFSFYQESKSDAVMEGFKNLTPTQAKVIRDGEIKIINAMEVVAGDLAVVQFGERVPADCRVIESHNLHVDNSSLTGESEPLRRNGDPSTETIMEAKNVAFFGTFFTEGSGKALVFATGDRTVMGSLAKATTTVVKNETLIKKEIRHFIHIMAGIAISLGVLFFLIALFATRYPVIQAVVFAIGVRRREESDLSFIVANVPEGLLPQLTVALTLTANKMKEMNVLVKNLETIETLGAATCIASDKTGTLTQNRMTVSHMVYGAKIHNSGGEAVSGTMFPAYDVKCEDFMRLHDVANLCNSAIFIPTPETEGKEVIHWKTQGDASESALIKFCHPLRDIIEHREKNPKVLEIPFNSVNKWKLTIQVSERTKNHILTMKGAPEKIKVLCKTMYLDGKIVPIEPYNDRIDELNLELASRGERVLAFACLHLDPREYPIGYPFDNEKMNFPTKDLIYCGMISLIDPPRVGVKEAVITCQEASIKVVMVTGDHPVTARAIARSVNIMPGLTREEMAKERGVPVESIPKEEVRAVVVPGYTLPSFTEEDWDYVLTRPEVVFARTLPEQKQEIVAHLQKVKHVVAVTGDGVNDSPALKKADIGIAMGIAGSDVAKEAADIILMDDNFASIVHGITEGRMIFDNLKKCICYVLSSNIPEVIPFLIFVVAKLPLALEIVMILVVDLGTDLMPAIALAYEEPEAVVMKRPPRNAQTDRLVNRQLFTLAYTQLGVFETLAGYFVFFLAFDLYGFKAWDLAGSASGFVLEEDDRAEYFNEMAMKNDVWMNKDSIAQGYENFHEYRVHALRVAQSAFLFAVVISQISNILCVKTKATSLFVAGIKNPWILASMVVEVVIIIIVVYAPPFNPVFSTSGDLWAQYVFLAVPVIPIMIGYNELRLFFIRRNPKGWVARMTAF